MKYRMHPEGMPPFPERQFWHTFQGAEFLNTFSGGIAIAQPPVNFLHRSAMR